MAIEIYCRPDFEYEAEDIFIRIDGVEMHYKGYDDVEWHEMESEVKRLVEKYGMVDLGELPETIHNLDEILLGEGDETDIPT